MATFPPYTIGIDLGGTKAAGLLLAPDGTVVARERVAIPPDTDGERLVRLLAVLVRRLQADGPPLTLVGVGIPGPPDGDGDVLPDVPNFARVGRLALRPRLAEATGCPVVLENDANCFALGEAVYGAGAGLRTIVGITLGTGLGVGIAVDGRIHRGAHWQAGEVWDLPLADGRIVEDVLAGRAVAQAAGTASAQEAAERARAGDGAALAAWCTVGQTLGWLIALLGRVLDPDLFVLGGSLSRAHDLFLPTVLAAESRWPIHVSADTEAMAARGAARAALSAHDHAGA